MLLDTTGCDKNLSYRNDVRFRMLNSEKSDYNVCQLIAAGLKLTIPPASFMSLTCKIRGVSNGFYSQLQVLWESDHFRSLNAW